MFVCNCVWSVIDKVNQVIFENQNTEALKVYEYQLDNFLYEIRAITAELHNLEADESKVNGKEMKRKGKRR